MIMVSMFTIVTIVQQTVIPKTVESEGGGGGSMVAGVVRKFRVMMIKECVISDHNVPPMRC